MGMAPDLNMTSPSSPTASSFSMALPTQTTTVSTKLLVEQYYAATQQNDTNVTAYSHIHFESIAEIEKHLQLLEESMDDFFIVAMSIIIFFMQAGFAFMEAGAVRSKNTTNILIKNLLDMLIGGIAYWLIGFPLAFGKGNSFMGWSYWASTGLPDRKMAHWFFDFVHAATASTLVSGSLAERCNFYAYLIYSFVITGIIYPIVSHWAWAKNGWLHVTSYKDYAGGGIVHMTGGVCAFVGAVLMGPRLKRFHANTGEPQEIRGHSVPLAALGGFILMFGFMAFAAGFKGHISQAGDGAVVSRAIVNSLLGACGGGCGALAIHRAGTFGATHTWSFMMAMNGALAGMVGVCAGSDSFYPWAAFIMGIGAGFIFLCLHFLLLKMKVDDPLDAVAVHFGGGLWGLLLVPFFMRDGIIFNPGLDSTMVLLWNLAGAGAIILWSGGLCFVMFYLFKKMHILRVSQEMELRGLDLLKHNEPAYPTTAWVEAELGQFSSMAITESMVGNFVGAVKRTVSQGESMTPLMLDSPLPSLRRKLAGPYHGGSLKSITGHRASTRSEQDSILRTGARPKRITEDVTSV